MYGRGERLDSLPFTTGAPVSVLTKVYQRAQSLGYTISEMDWRQLAQLQTEAPMSVAESLTLTDESFLRSLQRLPEWSVWVWSTDGKTTI